jgi:inner membrane protein
MWGRTHGEVGALAGASLAAASGRPEDMLPCAVIGYVAGLLPDIDKRKTTITKVPLLNLITIPLSWILSRKALTGGHRGVVHQWPGLLVWTALAYAAHLRGVFLLAFALGYLLHILCDMTTVSGVRFLWPLKMAHITPEGLRLNMEHPGEAVAERYLRYLLLVVVVGLWVVALAHLPEPARLALMRRTDAVLRSCADTLLGWMSGALTQPRLPA